MRHIFCRRNDEGLSMVFVAISVVPIIAMTALVLDAGAAYSTRRHMQNAADAASIAAARALDQARFRGGDASAVDSTARTIALANGSGDTAAVFQCNVVDKNKAVIAPCSATDTVSGWRAPDNLVRAAGVTVRAGTIRPTAFGGVIGHKTLTVRTQATASIQPLIGGDAPFMVCGNEEAGAESPGGPGRSLLIPDLTQYPPWRINPLAISLTYTIHGPQVADCGAPANPFKGLADGPVVLPDWLDTTTGVRAGPTRSEVAAQNGCRGTVLDDCILILPLCTTGRGASASTIEMFCVHMAAFYVNEVSANEHTGTLIGGVTAIGGQTGNGDISGNDVRVVKLLG